MFETWVICTIFSLSISPPCSAIFLIFFFKILFTQRRGKDLRTLRDTHSLQTECNVHSDGHGPVLAFDMFSDRAKLSFTYNTSHSHERMFQLTDNP